MERTIFAENIVHFNWNRRNKARMGAAPKAASETEIRWKWSFVLLRKNVVI